MQSGVHAAGVGMWGVRRLASGLVRCTVRGMRNLARPSCTRAMNASSAGHERSAISRPAFPIVNGFLRRLRPAQSRAGVQPVASPPRPATALPSAALALMHFPADCQWHRDGRQRQHGVPLCVLGPAPSCRPRRRTHRARSHRTRRRPGNSARGGRRMACDLSAAAAFGHLPVADLRRT